MIGVEGYGVATTQLRLGTAQVGVSGWGELGDVVTTPDVE